MFFELIKLIQSISILFGLRDIYYGGYSTVG